MPSPLALHVASDQLENGLGTGHTSILDTLGSIYHYVKSVRITSATAPDENRLVASAGPPSNGMLGSVSGINIPQLDTILSYLSALQPCFDWSPKSGHRQELRGFYLFYCASMDCEYAKRSGVRRL
jgi:hypothetical protein